MVSGYAARRTGSCICRSAPEQNAGAREARNRTNAQALLIDCCAAQFQNGSILEPGATMTVTLSIKNVPDEIARALRNRAARNHRSLQGELLAVLHEAALPEVRLSPRDVLERAKAAGVRTATTSAAIVRTDRDTR